MGTATLIYQAPVSALDPLSSAANVDDPLQQQLDVQSVSTVLTSPDVRARAQMLLGPSSNARAHYTISGAAGQPASSASTSVSYTNVATVTATSADAKLAARAANAYASAFIAFRKQYQEKQILEAETVVRGEMRNFTTPATQNSSDYIILEERLRDFQILASTVTGDFGIVSPAQTPATPFEPRPMRAAVLGFGVGLLVAIGLALLLGQLNTRLRDHREVAEILNMPVIGRIPTMPKRYGDDSLAVVAHPEGRAAEAFRMLRGNLEFVNVDDGARAILVTSCKQGEGKSLTVANLAATLALAGKRVVVVDGDLRRPQMHKYFGLDNEAGLSNVLSGQKALAAALSEVDVMPRAERTAGDAEAIVAPPVAPYTVRVLTSGTLPPNPGELIASKKFGVLLEHLRTLADIVLIDSPAIMAVGDAGALAAVADGLIMLVNIQEVRRPTLRDVCDVLEPLPCRKLGAIVVREKLRADESYRYAYYRYKQA
jgi:capsular exopolysaccharide synthesis family protein